ncbi:MAG TPA: CHAT domain-containing protein [Chthonomonadaceae bacterium]|nr:CHAT domain-containing protein [Chthonomonadaceae bacterium]
MWRIAGYALDRELRMQFWPRLGLTLVALSLCLEVAAATPAPQSSGILLSAPEKPAAVGRTDDDGAFRAREIWPLRLAADLVVLSGFQGADAASEIGDGMLALARSLHSAGARTVVVSRWKSGESAAPLMTAFHRHLRAGVERDVALRLAMVETKRLYAGEHDNPYYWAAFVLMGDVGSIR